MKFESSQMLDQAFRSWSEIEEQTLTYFNPYPWHWPGNWSNALYPTWLLLSEIPAM